jgi:hypothetical protein
VKAGAKTFFAPTSQLRGLDDTISVFSVNFGPASSLLVSSPGSTLEALHAPSVEEDRLACQQRVSPVAQLHGCQMGCMAHRRVPARASNEHQPRVRDRFHRAAQEPGKALLQPLQLRHIFSGVRLVCHRAANDRQQILNLLCCQLQFFLEDREMPCYHGGKHGWHEGTAPLVQRYVPPSCPR